MEEKNMNSNNQMNTNNENNKLDKMNNRNIMIIIMALVIVCLAGYIVYIKFIDKMPDKPKEGNAQEQGNNNSTPTPTNENGNNDFDIISKFTQIELSSSNKEITVGNTALSIKSSDNSLLVNNKKIYTSEWEDGTHTGYSVYTNDKSEYILIEDTYENICGDGLIVGAIDSKGEFVNVERKELSNHPDVPSCLGYIYLKDNKIYGTYSGDDIGNDSEEFSYEVEFIIK